MRFLQRLPAGELVVIDEIKSAEYKTKTMVSMLNAVGADRKALVVLPAIDPIVIKSCANIPGVKTSQWNTVNVYDILNSGKLVIDRAAVEKIEEVFA